MDKLFVSIVNLLDKLNKHKARALLVGMPALSLIILLGLLSLNSSYKAQKYEPANSILGTMIISGKKAATTPSTESQVSNNSTNNQNSSSSSNQNQTSNNSNNNSNSNSSNSSNSNSASGNQGNSQPQQPQKPVAGPPTGITGPANLTVSAGSTSISYTASTNDDSDVLWQPQNEPSGTPSPVFLVVPSQAGTTPTSTVAFQVEATSQAVVGQSYWVYLWINSNTMYPMAVTVTN